MKDSFGELLAEANSLGIDYHIDYQYISGPEPFKITYLGKVWTRDNPRATKSLIKNIIKWIRAGRYK